MLLENTTTTKQYRKPNISIYIVYDRMGMNMGKYQGNEWSYRDDHVTTYCCRQARGPKIASDTKPRGLFTKRKP